MKFSVKGCPVDVNCELNAIKDQLFRIDICEKIHGNKNQNRIHTIIVGPFSGQFKSFKTQLYKELDSKISAKKIGTINSIKLSKK